MSALILKGRILVLSDGNTLADSWGLVDEVARKLQPSNGLTELPLSVRAGEG